MVLLDVGIVVVQLCYGDWWFVEWCGLYQYCVVYFGFVSWIVVVLGFGLDQGGWCVGVLVDVVYIGWYGVVVGWQVFYQWQGVDGVLQ